jgi:hypothetical protein
MSEIFVGPNELCSCPVLGNAAQAWMELVQRCDPRTQHILGNVVVDVKVRYVFQPIRLVFILTLPVSVANLPASVAESWNSCVNDLDSFSFDGQKGGDVFPQDYVS